MRLLFCLATWAFIDLSNGVSTKMDFGEEKTTIVSNSSRIEDEDVEVKHTIVVSTKLKNNNRRGVHSDGDGGTLTYSVGQKTPKKEDSGEVPVESGYRSVDTTQIRTPDSRYKNKIYPASVFVNRNIRDEYDNVYPNVASNPMQWKPSTFYNNVNYYTPEGRDSYNGQRKNRPVYSNQGKVTRKLSEEGMREFYCKKCIEYSNRQGVRGCSSVIQARSADSWMPATTTPKIKIDGKLAKLN